MRHDGAGSSSLSERLGDIRGESLSFETVRRIPDQIRMNLILIILLLLLLFGGGGGYYYGGPAIGGGIGGLVLLILIIWLIAGRR
jgi:hypothetical protein